MAPHVNANRLAMGEYTNFPSKAHQTCLQVASIMPSPLHFSHFHVTNCCHCLWKWHHCAHVSFVRTLCCILLAAMIIGRETGKIYEPRSISGMNAVCQSGCSIIVPQHKSSSASRCSLRSFPPPPPPPPPKLGLFLTFLCSVARPA